MSSSSSLKAGVPSALLPSARLQPINTSIVVLQEPDGSEVRRTVLPGGLRVMTEYVPGVRSVAVGIWAGVGSRDETPEMAGSAHFLEHLLFKGTESRSALEISSSIESVGGEMNAFTSKEYTCYYARVLDVDTKLAVDVLADMIANSVITSSDFDQERRVILEEIAMRDDDHADNAHEAFAQGLFGESDLGRPILGTVDTINAAQRDVVWDFYKQHYTPEKLVVSIAGAIDHDAVIDMVRSAFGSFLTGDQLPAERRAPHSALLLPASVNVVQRATEQSHIIWGVPAYARGDDRRFAIGILNAVLGGGMSSRLFQEVREKRGLAYSVYSFVQSYADTGYFGVYVGSQPNQAAEAMHVIQTTLADMRAAGATETEILRGKGQLRGGLVLGQEDTGSRMTRIAKAELVSGELLSVSQVLECVDSVTLADITAIAEDLLSKEPTLGVVGPYSDTQDFTSRSGWEK